MYHFLLLLSLIIDENLEPKRNPEDYYDEDGLSLTISKENDNYRMKDNSGNTSLFIKNGDIWYLTMKI